MTEVHLAALSAPGFGGKYGLQVFSKAAYHRIPNLPSATVNILGVFWAVALAKEAIACGDFAASANQLFVCFVSV